MEQGFSKADSANLPKVDMFMVVNYFMINPYSGGSPCRNVKTMVSSQDSYGDDAVGYVQLKREANRCVVKCQICPEHHGRQQPYLVTMVIDETEEVIQSIMCNDCSASQGCCKHAVAFLMWMHRRSEEPACAEIRCYWKKSKLSEEKNTLKFIKIKDLFGTSSSSLQPDDCVFKEFLEESRKRKLLNCQILKHLSPDCESSVVELLSLHQLSCKYNVENNCENFLNTISHVFDDENVREVEKLTREQHKCPAWYELQYARITESKAYEVTQCMTSDDSLIELLMGAKAPYTATVKRSRTLGLLVRKQIEKKYGKIASCGLFISQQYPIIAASPDGILNGDTIIKINCPVNERMFKNYISNNKVHAKYYAQMQLLMSVTKLKKCLFCVVSWDFETTNKITGVLVDYDARYTGELISKLVNFWKNNIYQLLYESTKID